MVLATTHGKEAAFLALIQRKKENKTRERIDNASLCAGSPLHFDCISCGADIVVPANYVTRPPLCLECAALKRLGWLE